MDKASFDQLVNSVLGDTTPRVWSLLVTIFGDLAIANDARLSGATVNALTAAIGIKPEATRVAIHRLRKEGWIESHRSGRETRYGLTQSGRAETLAVRTRVYAYDAPNTMPQLVIDKTGVSASADPTRSVHIGPHIWVQVPPVVSEDAWALQVAAELPHWVRDSLCSQDAQHASQRLADSFARLLKTGALKGLSPLQEVALRVLLVHEWRRLVLRIPEFPDACFPDAWRGSECRTALRELMSRLPAPDPARLDQI